MGLHQDSISWASGASTSGLSFLLAGVCAAGVSTSSRFDGHVGAEVAAYADSSGGTTTGSFTLSTIPAGATILRATLYSNNFHFFVTPSAVFDSHFLGTTTTFDVGDNGFTAQKWDATAFVSGNGVYPVSATGFTQNYGLALVVVFSDASLPAGRVLINDGADDLCCGPDTETTTFDGLWGSGTLWVHTAADNNGGFGESDEVIRLNGIDVGGPLDANLGPYASLLAMPVTVSSGANSAEVFSPQDIFGWDLAVLHVAEFGSEYCTANANSTGSPADLSASGSPSSSAGDLTLTSAPVPDQHGIFFHGRDPIQTPFGNGFLCTTANLVRGAVVVGAGNVATYTYDNSDAKHGLAAYVGLTRNFQHWFHDPAGGGSMFNLSNAISIAILP